MNKKLKTYTLFLLTVLLISVGSISEAADWKWVISSDTTTYNIDYSSIYQGEDFDGKYLDVWVQCIYTNIAKERLVQKSNNKAFYSCKKSIHLVRHRSMNSKLLALMLEQYFYDNNGNIISSHSRADVIWNYTIVPPDSIGSFIFVEAAEVWDSSSFIEENSTESYLIPRTPRLPSPPSLAIYRGRHY